jgi:hypothetical protein
LLTLEHGNIVKGFKGIPSKRPILYIDNHMLL